MTERQSALVVLGDTRTARRLLRHAGERAKASGLCLVLLSVMPSEEFQARDWARLRIPELDVRYTVEAAEDEGERHGERLAREVLDGLGVEYVVDARVGRKASIVLDVADEYDCSEVYLSGRHNGPWGHTTFDRVMEEVVDRFDGPVTVMVEPDEDDERETETS